MRIYSLMVSFIVLFSALYFAGCRSSSDASVDLKMTKGLKDLTDISNRTALSNSQMDVAMEYKADRLYAPEKWENIDAPKIHNWDNVNKLISQQKYEAAYKELEDILQKLREKNDYEGITHTLMKMVSLRMSLHGYEAAVNFLKKEIWPDGLYSQMVLNLYYGYTLTNYYNSYSWEINQREKVETQGEVDLKKFTKDDIFYEAQKAYLNVFSQRENLSHVKIKSFSNYITPNSYPERIRGSLRDVVSYFYVELLKNTTLWRPEDLNDIFKLPLRDMMDIKKVILDLSQRDIHPLLKIVYILDDLYIYHKQKKEEEAAFEAYLTKLTVLSSNFRDKEDRSAIKGSLEKALKEMEAFEWWTVGMSALADMVMRENEPDSLVKAHKITVDCQRRFSTSIGAKMCLSKQKWIESPGYEISGMSVDGRDKRSILVDYKNLDRIYFRAFHLDFFSLIKSANHYIYPQYKKLDNIVFNERPDYEWSVSLEPTEDFKMHKKYVVPPFKKNGLYLVAASARKDFSRSDNEIKAIYVTISDMVLEKSQDDDGRFFVRVVEGNSGRPIPDVDVIIYRYDWQNGHHTKYKTQKTDSLGYARFVENYSQNSYFVVAKRGEDFTADLRYTSFYSRGEAVDSDRTIIFTDRSIYRPLQKIRWKIVHFHGSFLKGDYRVVPDMKIDVVLYDYNKQVVDKKQVTTNEFGTASGEFSIPKGRILGDWWIATSWGMQSVKVEEYKRPTFEVKLNEPKEALRLNKEAEITGDVKYYFGLPVTAGEVRYVITRLPVYPNWWYYYYYEDMFLGYNPFNRQAQTIATGRAALDSEGRFRIRFTPLVDERLSGSNKDIIYSYYIRIDVTDEGGETRSAEQRYKVGFSSVEAKINSDLKFFIAHQEENRLSILRTGLNGEPRPGRGRFRIVSLKEPERVLMPSELRPMVPHFLQDSWTNRYQKEDDAKSPRWESLYNLERYLVELKDSKEIRSGETSHDDKGICEVDISDLKPALYKIYYETVDDFGSKYETFKTFIVADEKSRYNLPLVFIAQKNSYKVGEKARVLISTGFDDSPICLYKYQSGKVTDKSLLYGGRSKSIYEIDIDENLRGGFTLLSSLINDYQALKVYENIMVPWDNKELKIEFVTFRDTLRPGQRETFKVRVTAPDKRKSLNKVTELLTYMYDRSIDYFAPHFYPLIRSLYPNKAGEAGMHMTNLIMARSNWVSTDGFRRIPNYPDLVSDYLNVASGYGIGGPGYRRRMMKMAEPMVDEQGRYRGLQPPPIPSRAPMSREETRKEGLAKDARKGDATEDMVGTQRKVELRTEFAETAFFIPHLLLESDNTASIEFNVPDSVTSYNLFVHAITKDLMGGSLQKEVKAIKELMVRPYLPRFLREGDEADLKVVINNASDKGVSGKMRFEIIDPATEKIITSDFGLLAKETVRQFTVGPRSSESLSFILKTPVKIDLVSFRITAVTNDFTDGELRQIPILPGRMHLVQSKFIVLKDRESKTIRFEDLAKKDDPTLINDQMVITLDAQLFFTVLQSLPYLVNYPYECTEQILNKFLSLGIVSSVYKSHPAVAKMAEIFSKERDQRLERWDIPDPNRKMLLEETPWLNMAKGGLVDKEDLVNILNPEIARTERDISLNKLRKAQTAAGGFPWFPGGPPSPYITLYILYGFSKALEFKVDVPRDMITKGWQYLHEHFITEVWPYAKSKKCCWEFITFLNYVLSNYPDSSYYAGIFTEEDRRDMLEFSFAHWKSHSPYLKGYLALTLERMNRHKDAVLVFESVMDSAKYSPEEGTHWAAEDRSWLWYNDSIETHAFAIRTLLEIMPKEKRLDGLVQWILMNKKLNHWKSTKATAEVIYSLIKYMEANKTLGIREEGRVKIGLDEYKFVFEPDRYTGKKNQIVIPQEKIDPDITSSITFEKNTKGFMFASATWHFSTERLPISEKGDLFFISRKYFKREPTEKGYVLKPIKDGTEITVGDQIEVQISIKSSHPAEYVHLTDPRPAGFEPESTVSRHRWDLGICWYEEVRDSAQNLFFEKIPQGEYSFKYRLRANMAGRFKVAPATIQSMYAPEFNAYSTGETIVVTTPK